MNMKNMVSKSVKRGALLLAVLLAFTACSKRFSLQLPLAVDSHKYDLSAKEGQARIFFYTTMPWTLSVEPGDCNWASVSRTSGDGKEDVEEIIFTYDENQDPDRQVTLVITAGELQETIIMFQKGVAREWWDGSLSVDDLVVKPQNDIK